MKPAHAPLWRLSLTVADAHREPFEAALAEAHGGVISSVRLGDTSHDATPAGWRLELLTDTPPDLPPLRAALALAATLVGAPEPETTLDPVPARDWLAENRQAFPALWVDRFHVHGDHLPPVPPWAGIDLTVNAGAAFGSGDHGTTRGCLRLLARMARRTRPCRVLDLGCGTAILALAAARLGAGRVWASDIDPRAVAVARETVAANGLAHRIGLYTAAGYGHRALTTGAPYDLVIANILARPLVALAPATRAHTRPGSHAILSGLLREQQPMVLAAWRRAGFALVARDHDGPWTSLWLHRPAR